jgi:hypothetical protein
VQQRFSTGKASKKDPFGPRIFAQTEQTLPNQGVTPKSRIAGCKVIAFCKTHSVAGELGYTAVA